MCQSLMQFVEAAKEIVLKIIAYGPREFFRGKECYWNVFDFAIVSVPHGRIYVIGTTADTSSMT